MSSGSRAARAAAAMMVFVTVAAIASVASASSGHGRARSLEMGTWTNFGWDGGNGAKVRPSFEFRSEGAVVDDRSPTRTARVIGWRSGTGRSSWGRPRYRNVRPAGTSTASGTRTRRSRIPAYSSGMFAVGGGRHRIQMIAVLSPFRGGSSFLRADPMTTAMCTDGGWAALPRDGGVQEPGRLHLVRQHVLRRGIRGGARPQPIAVDASVRTTASSTAVEAAFDMSCDRIANATLRPFASRT